jgi:hypothetical protein
MTHVIGKDKRTSYSTELPLFKLAVGALIGLVFAIAPFLNFGVANNIDSNVVVKVNNTSLSFAEYERALQLFASEKNFGITIGDRSLILTRMIEEELLVQYGIDEGLVNTDAAVRSEVLKAVMSGLMVELDATKKVGGQQHAADEDRNQHLVRYLAQLRRGAEISWTSPSNHND